MLKLRHLGQWGTRRAIETHPHHAIANLDFVILKVAKFELIGGRIHQRRDIEDFSCAIKSPSVVAALQMPAANGALAQVEALVRASLACSKPSTTGEMRLHQSLVQMRHTADITGSELRSVQHRLPGRAKSFERRIFGQFFGVFV